MTDIEFSLQFIYTAIAYAFVLGIVWALIFQRF